MSEDRQCMGTAADAKSALIEKAKAWRETRQPSMDTAAGHRERESVERELRFQLANSVLLWLWHEENPEPAMRPPTLVDREAVADLEARFLKVVSVMKGARNTPEKLMSVWADDMKAAEDVAALLASLSLVNPKDEVHRTTEQSSTPIGHQK